MEISHFLTWQFSIKRGAAERLQENWQYPRFSNSSPTRFWVSRMTCEGQIIGSFQEKLIYITTFCGPPCKLGISNYTICIFNFTSFSDRDGDVVVDIFRHYLHIFIFFIFYIILICIIFYSLGFKKNWNCYSHFSLVFIPRLVIQIRFEPHFLH